MHLPTFTLLIVEDLATHRELYREHLSHDSNCIYHVLEAESVAGGLELCRTRSIDAILLDYGLPDGDGLAFLAALDTQSNGSSLPVVMVTGIGNESIAVRAMKLGAEDYLVKCDLTPALLQSRMRSAIENTRLRLQLQQSQEQAKLLLQAKNQQITTIWESMTDAYVTLDREWRIIYANPTATSVVRQLVNLAPEKFLGQSYWEVFPWTVGSIAEPEYHRAVTDRVAVHFELLYEPTGTWFEIHAYPSEIGLGIYFRDITDRKRQEAALLQSERKFSAIFNQTLQLMGLVSLDGVLLEVNQTALNSIAAPESEIVGNKFWDAPWWHTEQLQQQLQSQWRGNDYRLFAQTDVR
jgi:DNA-binding response OmpR family regulator